MIGRLLVFLGVVCGTVLSFRSIESRELIYHGTSGIMTTVAAILIGLTFGSAFQSLIEWYDAFRQWKSGIAPSVAIARLLVSIIVIVGFIIFYDMTMNLVMSVVGMIVIGWLMGGLLIFLIKRVR